MSILLLKKTTRLYKFGTLLCGQFSMGDFLVISPSAPGVLRPEFPIFPQFSCGLPCVFPQCVSEPKNDPKRHNAARNRDLSFREDDPSAQKRKKQSLLTSIIPYWDILIIPLWDNIVNRRDAYETQRNPEGAGYFSAKAGLDPAYQSEHDQPV